MPEDRHSPGSEHEHDPRRVAGDLLRDVARGLVQAIIAAQECAGTASSPLASRDMGSGETPGRFRVTHAKIEFRYGVLAMRDGHVAVEVNAEALSRLAPAAISTISLELAHDRIEHLLAEESSDGE